MVIIPLLIRTQGSLGIITFSSSSHFPFLRAIFLRQSRTVEGLKRILVSYVSPTPPPLILSLARQNMILNSSQRDRIKPVTYSRLGMETFLVLTWWQRLYFNFYFRFQKGRSVKFYRSTTLSHRTRLPTTSNLGEIDRRSRLIVPQTSIGQMK